MHEIAKKFLLSKAHTKQLLDMLTRTRKFGFVNHGGIHISENEIKEELAKRPHVLNAAESKIKRQKLASEAQASREKRVR